MIASVVVLSLLPTQAPLPAVSVQFQLNDAMTKDKVLPGVGVGVATKDGGFLITGTTDDNGRYSCSLIPGTYYVTYRLDLYVPIERSPVEITQNGQVITTTLSMLMEAEESTGDRRVKIILNWGSASNHAKDVDSHLLCPCGEQTSHVYFSDKEHGAHRISLDVDDMDWGGPEAITLIDPAPGEYFYWVHNYTGSPSTLSGSAVTVRVLFGDRVAAEFLVPHTGHDDDWRPFKSLTINELLEPSLVPFTEEDLAGGHHLELPVVPVTDPVGAFVVILLLVMVPVGLLGAIVLAIRTRLRHRHGPA